MAQPTPSDAPPLRELIRRLNEFQSRSRARPALRSPTSSARHDGKLSGAHAAVLQRLRALSGSLADSLEQTLVDLNDTTRLTYVGPAGEAREVLRASIQILAPEKEVKRQPWFEGVRQGTSLNASQSERLRYAVQQRGTDLRHATEVSDMIDERIGRIGRMVYQRASAAFHAKNQQREVRVLVAYVLALLDDVLPD